MSWYILHLLEMQDQMVEMKLKNSLSMLKLLFDLVEHGMKSSRLTGIVSSEYM